MDVDQRPNGPVNLESKMLGGCASFVVTSVVCLLLSIAPFFVLLKSYLWHDLAAATAIGLAPAAVFGAISSRRTGLPGAAGFVSSAMSWGAFAYVRLEEMILAAKAERIEPPNYPEQFQWMLPIAWILASILIAWIAIHPGEIPGKD
jgi:hypothetical protein